MICSYKNQVNLPILVKCPSITTTKQYRNRNRLETSTTNQLIIMVSTHRDIATINTGVPNEASNDYQYAQDLLSD